jgi:pyruvate formate lyase activating enzyme
MHEALYWESAPEQKVKCLLCPHECLIPEGRTGVCRVRENRQGTLFTLVYGQPAAVHTDPVEKKPLYHFYPGKQILSVGTYGCNLRCSFCQNYHLSQKDHSSSGHAVLALPPEILMQQALQVKGNTGMAYTYNEPAIFYEYMAETAQQVQQAGMKNVMISNGFISADPLEKLLPLMDAFNIDLKSFRDSFYSKLTGGRLEPVLQTLKTIAKAGKHLEVTHLVIPGLNDDPAEFRAMVNWLAEELGRDIPLHLSRYFPAYHLDLPPTPKGTLFHFAHLAMEKLHFVYTGNVGSTEFSSTWCPECKNELVVREVYQTLISGLSTEGRCSRCGLNIPGIW